MKKQILVIILLAILLVSCLALTACAHTHEYGEWTVVKQPTCTQDGSKERSCECGEKLTEVIVSIGHSYTAAVTNPTCTSQGYTTHTCSNCGYWYYDAYVNKLGHNFENDVCVNCGLTSSIGLRYSLSENKTYCVIGRGTCADGCIIIPSTYNGLPVECVHDWAFLNDEHLTSVIIPDSVKSIGPRAFENCDNLISINIPNSVTNIGDNAFSWSSKLSSIIIPSSVTNIGQEAFVACTSLANITIEGSPEIEFWAFNNTAYYNKEDNWKDGVLYIGNCLIEAKDTIETCTIKKGTTTIAENAFSECYRLESIIIPASVKIIGWGAFYDCYNLSNMTFEDPNNWYATQTKGATSGMNFTLTSPSRNATYLTDTHDNYYWYKK